jgi:type I restriction-modification system DNA methylase subunit
MKELTIFPEPDKSKKKKRGKAAKDAEEIGTSRELYNFLFEACNIIRGPVSQDTFKEYITPLLYSRRISDLYDEYRFCIIDGCRRC